MNQDNSQMVNPQEKRAKGEMVMCTETHLFSGPLPPPEVFGRYEQILHGSADRILKMAEEQSSHRQFLEKRVIGGDQFRANVGLFLGFIIGMTVIIGGLAMIYLEKDWQGFLSLFVGIGSLVGTFVYGKKQKEGDLRQKDEELRNRVRELEGRIKKNSKIIDGETGN